MAGRGILGSILLAIALAACGPAEAPAADPGADMPAPTPDAVAAAERQALARCGDVTAEGYCGVRFGMPVEAARQAFPVPLESYEAREDADVSTDRCHELFAALPVTGISFLAEGGVVGRIDVITPVVRTADGFGVDTQASAIRTRFGDTLGMATNTLEPEITDLSVTQGETKFVFEILDGVVRGWRAGIAPTIDYVAHCG